MICISSFVEKGFSQEVLQSLLYNPVLQSQPKVKLTKQTQQATALFLPFLDDFSGRSVYPDVMLWDDDQVYVNQQFAVFPPTVGTATFDALDSKGNLYPQEGQVVFGADTLTSRKIRLDSLMYPLPRKLSPSDSVYLSFYIQPGGGYGEVWNQIGGKPGSNDSLILEFFNPLQKQWNYIWGTGGFSLDNLLAETSYYFKFIMIPVTDRVFFSPEFKFRFRNYCSLSINEPDDRKSNTAQWHLDYVYLDIQRKSSVFDSTVRDVAFVTPAQSVLEKYESMPANQYRTKEIKSHFQNKMANLYYEILPCDYQYYIKGTSEFNYKGGVDNVLPFFQGFQYNTSPGQVNPPTPMFPEMRHGNFAFDVVHTFKEGINSNDFCPQNDTVVFKQVFWNYYAYDDGSSENGYGIVTQGMRPKMAYRFDLNEPDTLVALSIFFNRSLNDANRIPFKITIWTHKEGKPDQIIYQDQSEKLPVFEGLNIPHRYNLDHSLIVSDTLYIGFEQMKTGFINMGFDRNHNASAYLFINADGNWKPTFLQGAVMMRPYFGIGGTVGIPGVSKNKNGFGKIYPNPAQSVVHIQLDDHLKGDHYEMILYNLIGEVLYTGPFKNEFQVENLPDGIYIVLIFDKQTGLSYKEKIVISK